MPVLLSRLGASAGLLHMGRDVEITGIAYDSRRAGPGQLFAALSGRRRDGHDFIADAVGRGCAGLLVERAGAVPEDVPYLLACDSRRAMALAATVLYGHPTGALRLCGVTGTNGKTTTTFMVRHLLQGAGIKTGLVGTVHVLVGDTPVAAGLTTPEAPDLQEIMAGMVREGCQAAVMEVSSIGLELERTTGCEFDAAVFTNLTQDHLDLHGTMEAYRDAKARLFAGMGHPALPPVKPGPRVAVINADDPSGAYMAGKCRVPVITYGLQPGVAVRATGVQLEAAGNKFTLESPQGTRRVHQRLAARFNLYNALAAAAVALHEGVDLDAVVEGLETMPGVPGRFEMVHGGQEYAVIVDYAHTPDALENVLRAARRVVSGKVIVVFGCGGDRDATKRPRMGEVAARLADLVVVTSDNPRSEEPGAILSQIAVGLQGQATPYVLEADRARAIALALAQARPGDGVIIAGKGHETYQACKDHTIDFDDRAVALARLREVNSG
ncbi:MAG TPA: UDP-N-acetylmuramoyl-L-alanyl-D-glutamate--2,6-diaminopimelate ligase [Clostridiales bacterium UBA8153]|nr:UDP-N-acetylmuramoyl-L-alanyl-D-glutamate--2,6-diaminopimelate ligase [Clostridiales bacterium UBA8153]